MLDLYCVQIFRQIFLQRNALIDFSLFVTVNIYVDSKINQTLFTKKK